MDKHEKNGVEESEFINLGDRQEDISKVLGERDERLMKRREETIGTTPAIIFYTDAPFYPKGSDCVMERSSFVLYNTGTGTFDADISSSDDDDEFSVKVAIFGADNKVVVVFPSSLFWVHEMPHDNTWYHMHKAVSFDPNLFASFHHAIIYAKC